MIFVAKGNEDVYGTQVLQAARLAPISRSVALQPTSENREGNRAEGKYFIWVRKYNLNAYTASVLA